MLNENEAGEVIGKTAYADDGEKIGKVGQVFLDDQSGRPEFLTVNTGLFGTSESFVPVEGASVDGDDVTVPFGKDKVKNAPRVDLDDGHLEESDEQRLYEYYNSGYGETGVSRGDASEGHDTSGPTTDEAMTRSEEHLDVGTTSQAAGRARLRKYVTTENETVTVPVRKERAVLETEPVDGSNIGDATESPAISEEEHEVVLNEERVVVDKVAEPVERVRLGTETVTEQETVSDEVRKEHIEVEGDVDRR
ncbi:MAG: PRC-barrel domain protein [Marmoricola sp.]|nr:PRC-barrel domain protein [Marmoricola sp.]